MPDTSGPGVFLPSEGCLHPTNALASGKRDLVHAHSRARVIALIDAMQAYCGARALSGKVTTTFPARRRDQIGIWRRVINEVF